ncbi:NAD(P)/FAD-dependent oxidoreductase [Microtetraspora malaysiensis]|uniref:NAD(P)/FAD-dependent oxidoreductase n=1 Tax=Microtetraspora malaysiensis TaxID=161358 RepID=UPI003D8BBF48
MDRVGRSRRREVAAGAVSGLLAGLLVGPVAAYSGMMRAAPMAPGWLLFGVYATITGVVLGAIARQRRPAPMVAAGLLIGLLAWVGWTLTVEPLLHGQLPNWSARAAADGYRALVADSLHGALTGALLYWLSDLVRVPGPPVLETVGRRVVVVGGGFAGVAAAQRLEDHAARGRPFDVTILSDSNYLLFTPMLAEVAGGALEAQHITAPVRAACPRTRFVKDRAETADLEHRLVRTAKGAALPYDHLVLAVGAVPHFFDLPGVAEHAFTLKSLGAATALRDHVLGLLEQAEAEPDKGRRAGSLTFVVAGGGFAGTETIAELFDLVHGVLHFYPRLDPGEPRFVLAHPGARILPELSAELGAYALDRLQARGIEFRLGTRVASANAQAVRLLDGTVISTQTLVWTAGNRPSPLIQRLPIVKGKGGTVITDGSLKVIGAEGVWAVGDCAQIPTSDGFTHPPTAQHAVREGRTVADNIAAVTAGREPSPFRFRTRGTLVALGHRTACAEIRGRRFSGLAAWLLWRGIYLAKLPGLEKRLRVLFDWLLDLGFPRDITVTTPLPVKEQV